MAKELPKKWWASTHSNSISLKKTTAENLRWERMNAGSFHDTWEEAHAALLARREEEFKRAEREFQSRRTALMKAKLMKPPQPSAASEGKLPSGSVR